MAKEEGVKCVSLPASGDLSSDQYKFVDVNSSGQIAVVATAGAKSAGILQDKPNAAGRPGAVAISGIVKAKFSGSIAAGTEISVNASGLVVAATNEYRTQGIVVENPGGANLIGTILLSLNGGQLNAAAE